MLQYEKISVSEELTLIKQAYQKNVCSAIIGILNMLDLNLNRMFVINVMIFW